MDQRRQQIRGDQGSGQIMNHRRQLIRGENGPALLNGTLYTVPKRTVNQINLQSVIHHCVITASYDVRHKVRTHRSHTNSTHQGTGTFLLQADLSLNYPTHCYHCVAHCHYFGGLDQDYSLATLPSEAFILVCYYSRNVIKW